MDETIQPDWMKNYVPAPPTGNPAWQKGMASPNPKGRPPGQNKQTKLMKRMLDEAGDVLDKVIEKAKEGDPASAGLMLSRILPTLRSQLQTVEFDFDPELPIAKQVEQVLAAVAAGQVPPDVGQTIISSIGTLSTVRATENLEERIIALEAREVN